MKFSHAPEEQIRGRAYTLYLQRGRRHGHDRDDWLQSEYEWMQLPVRKIAELSTPRHGKGSIGGKSLIALVRKALSLGTAALPRLGNSRW
jgi:hypothetical protein